MRGQRVLITGSGRGIGQAIARRFAQAGARLHLVARGAEELEQTRRELAPLTEDVRISALDLTLPDSASRLLATVNQQWNGLDILVTNAGATPQGGFLELNDADWPKGFELKLFANLRVIKSAWPALKASGGSVVMIGGGTARMPKRQVALVSAVNGGIAALSKAVAEQGVLDGVQVNLVQPGTVKTSRRQKLFEHLAAEENIPVAEFIRQAPERLRTTRLGEPADIAAMVHFLCTPEARWVHGAIIDVDGGENKSV